MAKYKFVGPSNSDETIFIAKYEKGKEVKFLLMTEGKEYDLTAEQIEMLPKQGGSTHPMFEEVVVAPPVPDPTP